MEQRSSKLRSVVAGVLLVAMLAAVPFVLLYENEGDGAVNLPDTAVLYFDGVRISLADDGGIQALVDVYVQPHEKYQYTFMYTFFLKYNDELWQPSDHDTNQSGTGTDIEFFRLNEELFMLEDSSGNPYIPTGDKNPFDITTYVDSGTSKVPVADNMLYVQFALDRACFHNEYFAANSEYDIVKSSVVQGDGMGEFGVGESQTQEPFYYLENVDKNPLGIKLGTLSFRVEDTSDGGETDDREVLRKLTENWDGEVYAWYDNEDYNNDTNRAPDINSPIDNDEIPPLYVVKKDPDVIISEEYPWSIGYYELQRTDIDLEGSTEIYHVSSAGIPEVAAAVVSYDFGDELITAKPLLKDVTINAYQAYTYEGPGFAGSEADLARYNLAVALQKYAPTVEASYVDSRVENFTLNWGVENGVVDSVVYEHDYTIYQRIPDAEAGIYINNPDTEYVGVIVRDIVVNGVTVKTAWRDIDTAENYEYDPHKGEYIASQYLYYTATVDDVTVTLRYPTPMEVHLTVTPVTVTSVTADALDRTYTSTVAEKLDDVDALQLPDEIKLHTDVISGAPSLFLEVGSELPIWQPTDLSALTGKDSVGTEVKWYAAGKYPFTIGTLATTGSDSASNRRYSAVYGSEIEQKYPWLTTSPRYNISATRTVLPEDVEMHTDYTVSYVETTALDYQEIIDYTDDDLKLVLRVTRNSTTAGDTFPSTTAFRIRMPNGVEIGTGILSAAGGKSASYTQSLSSDAPTFTITIEPGITSAANTGESEAALAHRETIRRWINLGGYYEVAICENADAAEDAQMWTEFFPVYVESRANLYEENKEYNFIGLNADLIDYPGLFSDTITLPKGEYRPVIVSTDGGARPNTLSATTESYGIMTTYDGMTGAQPGEVFTFRVEHTDTVDTDPNDAAAVIGVWDTETPDSKITGDVLAAFNNVLITRYNAKNKNDFADMIYNAYGKVSNTTVKRPNSLLNDKRPYEPTIRVEKGNAEGVPLESVRLIYEGDPAPNNIITSPSADGLYDTVTTVVFDNKTYGYTVRQSFTLTILNDGETDIDGLYIDSLLDLNESPYNEDRGPSEDSITLPHYGAHFEITNPPASFLPAGAKTTFTVTYTFNLKVLTETVGTEDVINSYLDKLYVCSNVHGPGELADFDATFRVEEKEVNRVTVVVLPPFMDTDGSIFYLGEAGVITGLVTENGNEKMDYTYASTMRTKEDDVYIGTFPYEEYSVKAILSSDGINPEPVPGHDGAYTRKMPGYSITIYVIFEETTRSKLRPEEINVYAAKDVDTVVDRTLRNETRKVLWQKSFTEDEQSITNPYALMEKGAADVQGYNASHDQYLVVLEEDENYVQADVLLRKVKALYTQSMAQAGNVTYDALKELDDLLKTNYASTYRNTDIGNTNIDNIDILMKVYDVADLNNLTASNADERGTVVYNSTEKTIDDGTTIPVVGDDKRDDPTKNDGNPGSTANTTRHTGIVFDAPEMGGRRWLVITLSHTVTGEAGGTDIVTERSYYIELVRRPSHSVTLNYGNSPVGMIYNTDYTAVADAATTAATNLAGETITVTADNVKKQALDMFIETRTFDGYSAYNMSIDYTSAGVSSEVVVPVNLLPYALTHTDTDLSTAYNYNREAWIPYGMLYDPDSLTYTDSYTIGDYDTATNTDTSSDIIVTDEDGEVVSVTPVLDEYDTYATYHDLDLDPYSLFMIIGEDFVDPGLAEIRDSSMRLVEPERVTRYIRDAVYVSATTDENGKKEDLTGKGFFELAADDGSNVETDKIYLGTLDASNYIVAEYWQATHDYQQAVTDPDTIIGGTYPIFTYTYIDDKNKVQVETYFYQESTGNYFEIGSPHVPIDDEKIPYLEPLYEDVDNTAIAIRPGVYDLVYEFEDFDNTVTLQVIRKLIVLGPVGDATANGKAHDDDSADTDKAISDETRIEERVNDPLGYDYGGGFDGSNAFKFRTVDANNDRNVNNIDANKLHSALAGIKQFYEPIHYSAASCDAVPKTTEEEGVGE